MTKEKRNFYSDISTVKASHTKIQCKFSEKHNLQRLIFLKHFHLRWTNRSITDCTQVIDEFEAKKGRIETADEKAIRHSKKRKFEHELKPFFL